MDAEILPLRGKYYGTKIEIKSGLAKGGQICLWFATGEPSDREISSWGHTREEWASNAEIDDGWGGKSPIQSCDFICDSHYECAETYRIAKAITEMLRAIA